jgi:hypothetical protein
VHKSAPVKIIMHNPYGKTSALIVRINPGAFSWNQVLVFVLRAVPHAKASRHPAETELRKTLSRRVFPLAMPARATRLITSVGVYASILRDMLRVSIDVQWVSGRVVGASEDKTALYTAL